MSLVVLTAASIENKNRTKRVESTFVLRLDEGSIPSSSTNEIVKKKSLDYPKSHNVHQTLGVLCGI